MCNNKSYCGRRRLIRRRLDFTFLIQLILLALAFEKPTVSAGDKIQNLLVDQSKEKKDNLLVEQRKDKKDKKKDKQDHKNKPDKFNNNNNKPQQQWSEDLPLLDDDGGGRCTLCADGSEPDVFLKSYDLGRDCTELMTLASTLKKNDPGCSAVQVLGHQSCACPTYPNGYCTLCQGGFSDIPYKDKMVSSTCGYTCRDLLFVQESAFPNGCNGLRPFRGVCGCPEVSKSCPVCENSAKDYHRNKLYKEYGLTCEDLGMARDLGYSSSCVEIQRKFRYFCGCPGATPECTLCQQGKVPKEPDKKIPILQTTCGEINDLSSLYSKSECAMELNTMDYNAAGFCGCPYNGPLLQCNFCEPGTKVRNPNKIPRGSTDGSTCEELEEFARYIWTPTDLCTGVQSYAEECCG